jgi:hypothetical protein
MLRQLFSGLRGPVLRSTLLKNLVPLSRPSAVSVWESEWLEVREPFSPLLCFEDGLLFSPQ